MTLIRIAALSLLLGSAVAGVVWFLWGAAENLLLRNTPEPEATRDAMAPAEKAGPGKAA
jgi:hypothetical protein